MAQPPDEYGRDYIADFQKVIDAHMPTGDYVLPLLAADIVAELREQDQDLLGGWLWLNAEQLVTGYLGDRLRAQRNRRRADGPRSAFAEAAAAFGDGDDSALDIFKKALVIDDHKTRRPIGKMTAADHRYVAKEYHTTAKSAQVLAGFHEAIARRIPNGKTTADIMDEAEYLRLRDSIGKTA